jgi:hypothetical protein
MSVDDHWPLSGQWVPEELNLSTPAALFHRVLSSPRLSLLATLAWGHGSDSNGHCAGFEATTSYQLAAVALVQTAGFEPALFTASR